MDLFSEEDGRPKPQPLVVYHARFERQARSSWRELFAGFSTLHAVTYSSSLRAIALIADLVQEIDVQFGFERTLTADLRALEAASVSHAHRALDALADQHAVLNHVLRPLLASSDGKDLLERIRTGKASFSVLRETPSHEKIYCLAGEGRWRVIVGSANLSLSALTGRLAETFILFEEREAYECFRAEIEKRREYSEPIAASVLIVESEKPPTPLPLGELPALKDGTSGVLRTNLVVALPAPVVHASPADMARALTQARSMADSLKRIPLEETPRGQGAVAISTKALIRAWSAPKTAPARDKDGVPERVDVRPADGVVLFGGTPWLSAEDRIEPDLVASDAELLAAVLDSFGLFHGRAAELVRSYWTLLCWAYVAPFFPELRSLAVQRGEETFDLPMFAILYGRSSAGKSAFSRIVAQSMFGVAFQVEGRLVTAAKVMALREVIGVQPMLLDDVDARRMRDHLPDLLKTDRLSSASFAPVIVSTNRDVQSVPPDLRKRAVIIHADAAKPNAMSSEPALRATRIGTALYRAFLLRAMPMAAEVAMARANGARGQDLLHAGSTILTELLASSLGRKPEWAVPLQSEALDTLRDRPFLDEIRDLVDQNLADVDVIGRKMSLSFRGDEKAAQRFERLAPSQVLDRRLADRVILDLDALEKDYRTSGWAKRRRTWGNIMKGIFGR